MIDESIRRIATRTGVSEEDVVSFAAEFRNTTSVLAVINYLEKRIATMRGDENPRFELEQIRKDLGTLGVTGLFTD